MADQEGIVADSGQGAVDTGSEPTFDIDQASNDLAGDLFPTTGKEAHEGQSDDELPPDESSEHTQDSSDAGQDAQAPTSGAEADAAAQAKPVPKTWPKEMHDHWAKTPKEVQDYWETREKQMLDGIEQYKGDANYGKAMRDAITPYMALIQAQGIDAPRAVQALLNAHYKLSVSSPSQKQQYLQYIAKQYGIDTGQAPQGGQQDTDLRYQQLQDEVHNLKQVINQGTQSQLNAERERIGKEVNAFASDPAHPYFDEVADDIIVMLKAGLPLQDAYDRAVWANPVTRAKETARLQTEAKADAEKKAREQAEAAKKAAAANIRTRDTRRTPTENTKGTMRNLDSVMTEVMRELKQTH